MKKYIIYLQKYVYRESSKYSFRLKYSTKKIQIMSDSISNALIQTKISFPDWEISMFWEDWAAKKC